MTYPFVSFSRYLKRYPKNWNNFPLREWRDGAVTPTTWGTPHLETSDLGGGVSLNVGGTWGSFLWRDGAVTLPPPPPSDSLPPIDPCGELSEMNLQLPGRARAFRNLYGKDWKAPNRELVRSQRELDHRYTAACFQKCAMPGPIYSELLIATHDFKVW